MPNLDYRLVRELDYYSVVWMVIVLGDVLAYLKVPNLANLLDCDLVQCLGIRLVCWKVIVMGEQWEH